MLAARINTWKAVNSASGGRRFPEPDRAHPGPCPRLRSAGACSCGSSQPTMPRSSSGARRRRGACSRAIPEHGSRAASATATAQPSSARAEARTGSRWRELRLAVQLISSPAAARRGPRGSRRRTPNSPKSAPRRDRLILSRHQRRSKEGPSGAAARALDHQRPWQRQALAHPFLGWTMAASQGQVRERRARHPQLLPDHGQRQRAPRSRSLPQQLDHVSHVSSAEDSGHGSHQRARFREADSLTVRVGQLWSADLATGRSSSLLQKLMSRWTRPHLASSTTVRTDSSAGSDRPSSSQVRLLDRESSSRARPGLDEDHRGS